MPPEATTYPQNTHLSPEKQEGKAFPDTIPAKQEADGACGAWPSVEPLFTVGQPLLFCERCAANREVTLLWNPMSDGRFALTASCGICKRYVKHVPQTDYWRSYAPSPTPPRNP